MTPGWCKSNYGVRKGCQLLPLLFNIYITELGKLMSMESNMQSWKMMVSRNVIIKQGFYREILCVCMVISEYYMKLIM